MITLAKIGNKLLKNRNNHSMSLGINYSAPICWTVEKAPQSPPAKQRTVILQLIFLNFVKRRTELPCKQQVLRYRSLTSPPLTYSITKHKRSFVWKEYFKDLKWKKKTRYIIILHCYNGTKTAHSETVRVYVPLKST